MSTHVMTGTLAHDIESGERVAAVMASESEVCHKFAAGRQDHARFRAIYFSGSRLYSYGSHYVIAWLAEPGVVLLNSERNSMTTNGHVRAASSATRHMTQHWIPDLTRALKILDNFKRYRRDAKAARKRGEDSDNPESYGAACERRAKSAKAELRRFVLDNWRGFDPDQGAAAYLLGLASFDGWRTWHAIKAEGARIEAKEKAERQARDKARALADAKQFGDCSRAEFIRYWPADSYEHKRELDNLADGYGEHAQKSFAKRLAAAHKASKAAGYTTRTRNLWARLKDYREYMAGRPARVRAAYVAEKRAAFVAWRDHGAAKPPLWQYTGRALAEERAALEAADLAEREAKALADYESWRQTPTAVKRPDSRRFAEGSTPRLVLEGFEREEAEAAAKALEAWRASRGGRSPSAKPDSALFPSDFAARWPDLAERLGGDPWRELLFGTTREEEEARKAALEAAERLRQASEAEKLEAWRNGAESSALGQWSRGLPDGSAALRIAGDILETSQGARVPLAEAVAAFRFVKLLRQRQPAELEGEEPGVVWKANGRQVRVGSYALTRVYADGSFVAGCHSIRWPEIERAALAAGVFEAEPSAAAEVTSSH